MQKQHSLHSFLDSLDGKEQDFEWVNSASTSAQRPLPEVHQLCLQSLANAVILWPF